MAPKLARNSLIAGLFYLSLGLAGCGGGGSVAPSPTPPAIKVSISPSTASVTADSTQQFTATVANTTNKQVTWAVSGATGGNSTLGTINGQGLYTAPDPLPNPGSVTVTATSQADSTKSASASVSLTYPAPSISGITPASALLNSGDTAVTVSGTGFTRASSVDLGGSNLATSYVSSTQLAVTVPSSSETAAQVYRLTVNNPSPGGGASNSVEFTVGNPAPVVTSITPSVLAVGSPDTSVTVRGGDFIPGSQIQLNGGPLATTFISSTQLSTTVASDNLSSAGTAQITVVTPGPGGGTSTSQALTITAVKSFLIIAVPPGDPTGVWNLTVQAADGNADPVAGIPVTLKASQGSLSSNQGLTDALGTLHASISPPAPYTGGPIAVIATTGAQTAAVNITFLSSSAVSPFVAASLRETLSSSPGAASASSSSSTITAAPFLLGTSGPPGASNPFANPDPCFTRSSLSTIPSVACQTDLSQIGVRANLLDVANSVCHFVSLAVGVAGCAGTVATIVGCAASGTGVGAALCVGGLAYIDVLSGACVGWLGSMFSKAVTGGTVAGDTVDAMTFQPGSTNPLDYGGLICDAVDSASIGSGTGTSGVGITIIPSKPVVTLGSSLQFAASLSGTTDDSIVWAINGIVGGAGPYGTISPTGLYLAPSALPNPTYLTVSATSVADPTAIADADLTLVNSSGVASSGSTAIMAGLVGGQLVDKAYVPVPTSNLVSVVNLDAAQGTNPVIKLIHTPNSYSPNATAADQLRSEVLAISYSSPDIQVIDASSDVLVTTLGSPVTTSVGFSGGSCMICGIAVDPSSDKAVLDTAQGYLVLNLSTQTFSPFLPAAPAENFGYNPNGSLVLSPTYGVSPFNGLQIFNLLDATIFNLSSSVGSYPDAAAVDINTGIAAVPDEYTGDQYLLNMQGALLNSATVPPSFTTPSTVFHINFTNCGSELYDWSLVSAESSTHLLFLGTEFADCAAVESLPAAPLAGTPPLPSIFKWGHMPIRPDGFYWNNGGDPHGIAVFSSVVDGKAYGFLVSDDANWVARIDLSALARAPNLSGGGPNEVDLSPYVLFFNTQ